MTKILAHPLGFTRRPITLRNHVPKNYVFSCQEVRTPLTPLVWLRQRLPSLLCSTLSSTYCRLNATSSSSHSTFPRLSTLYVIHHSSTNRHSLTFLTKSITIDVKNVQIKIETVKNVTKIQKNVCNRNKKRYLFLVQFNSTPDTQEMEMRQT